MRKIYYYVELENISPIHIGNGENQFTDSDVLLDDDMHAFIPGTSMAGCFLHYVNEEERKLILPMIKDKHKICPIFFSDAVLKEGNSLVEKRDGVLLDEFKSTVENAKYDYQVVSVGNHFDWRIEVDEWDDDSRLENIVEHCMNALDKQDIKVGFKTTRGLGSLKVCKFGKKIFTEKNIDDLFSFNRFEFSHYENVNDFLNEFVSSKYTKLSFVLEQDGGINIRMYNTKKGEENFEHIRSNGIPVIPGTSWNGLIRHSFSKYCKEFNLNLDLNQIFGFSTKNTQKKSSIYIEESILNDGFDLTLTRTRIDPFHGSTVHGSLYKEKSYYCGNTVLNINIDKSIPEYNCLMNLFEIFVNDLNQGFVAIGGETSVGRGIFKVKKVYVDEKEESWLC